MTDLNNPPAAGRTGRRTGTGHVGLLAAAALGLALSLPAAAEDDLRYSWFQISWAQQDVSRSASQTLIIEGIPQTVDLDADDGDGIDFQASIGTWHNFYLFGGFTSTDIDITAVITNPNVTEEATDEFDLTTIRGGIGYRYQLFFNTNVILEASYDSLDFDFGSLAGEDFDTDDQGPGAKLGIRTLLRDRLELRAFGRYTSVGDVDVNTGEIDDDLLFGGGFGFTLIRGLSITGDVEIGEIDTYTLGVRLDLSED